MSYKWVILNEWFFLCVFPNMQDSGLGPGTYNLKSSTELILSRRVSKRSPYDPSTGKGNIFTAPVSTTFIKTKDHWILCWIYFNRMRYA